MLCDTLIRHKELRAGYIGFEKIQAKIARTGWAIHQSECRPPLCATAAHQGERATVAERSRIDGLTGRLHVRRAKNGSPSVHPMQGDEIRALRRLQREQGLSSHVFMTERDGPMTPKAFHALFGRIRARAKMQFPIHPHMLRHGCGYALANATTHGRYRLGSVTRTSSALVGS